MYIVCHISDSCLISELIMYNCFQYAGWDIAVKFDYDKKNQNDSEGVGLAL